jgi:hypothetical protein
MKRDAYDRMLLPYEQPRLPGEPLPAIPTLWEKAAQMFARVIEHIGSTSRLASAAASAGASAELANWLSPAQHAQSAPEDSHDPANWSTNFRWRISTATAIATAAAAAAADDDDDDDNNDLMLAA